MCLIFFDPSRCEHKENRDKTKAEAIKMCQSWKCRFATTTTRTIEGKKCITFSCDLTFNAFDGKKLSKFDYLENYEWEVLDAIH